MAVKAGYKQTEVGVIPEDWEVAPLGRLAHSVEYGSSAKSNVKGQIPVLRMGNLQSGKIDWSDLVFTNDEFEIRKYALNPGDVLFNRTNTIDLVGKTAIYKGERPAIFAGYLIRVNIDKTLLDSEFLNYVLNAEFSRKYSAKILSVAVGQANINGQKLKTYPIPLPPTLAEQQAIAEALSDVDGLISALDALIAKKRAIKQGAMQELLTGQRRLPGFAGEWAVKMLGEIAEVSSGGTPDRKEASYWNGTIPWVTTSQIDFNRITAAEEFITEVGLASSSAKKFSKNTLLMAMYGQGKTRGKVAILGIDATINQACAAISIQQNTSVEYIFFNLSQRYEEIRGLSNTGNQENLNGNIIKSIPILLPPLAEQTAIAQLLADMDGELAALAAKRAKTVAVKQGMMQTLLTGQVRLV